MSKISVPVRAGEIVAVTGATGLIGSAVCRLLEIASDCEVRALTRGPDTQGLENPVFGDLGMKDFSPLLEGASGLVHCAFAHVPGKYRGGEGDDPARFWDLNIGGTIRLLERAKAMGVRRVVLFSSRAVYASGEFEPGERIDETYLGRPDTHYGLQKQALEGMARSYSNTNFTISVLRPTGVYGGPAQTNKWRDLFFDAAQGVLPKGNRTSTEVHVETVAHAASCLLGTDQSWVAGETINLSEVKVSQSQILSAAGFDVSAMLPPDPMKGPELISDRARDLGVALRGVEALETVARDLRTALQL